MLKSWIARDLASGVLTGVVSLAFALSCAALIFSGQLSGALGSGITAMLVAMTVCALVVAVFSPFVRAIAGPDGNAAAVLGTMAAAIAAEMTGNGASHEAILATVLCGLAVATAVTGLVLFLLGEMRAARWVRFIPYPVIGGFISAVACLLIAGAIHVGTGISLDLHHLAQFAQPLAALRLLLTVGFGVAIVVATARVPNALGLALVLLVGVPLADAVFAFLPGGLLGAAGGGWLLAPDMRVSATPWYLVSTLSAVSWPAILHRGAEIVTVVLVTTITILVNATAFEMDSRIDADFDKELRADGLANLASAACGGFTGYIALARSVLNLKLGASGRLSGITVGIVGLAVLLNGARIIELVPSFVLGGLLLYIGITMLDRWVLKASRRLARLEFLALLVILAVNLSFGFLAGLVVGLIVGTALFAFNYSRVAVIAQSHSGLQIRSSLMRAPAELATLAQYGDELRIFALQGFLFFGMADRLYRTIYAQAIQTGARYIVLDFRLVIGIDAAAAASFVKMIRAAQSAGSRIVFTAMDEVVARQWIAACDGVDHDIEHFRDLDHAVEWCEDRVIDLHERVAGEDISFAQWLAGELGGSDLAARFAKYLAPTEVAAGEILFREGDPADSMFFIERGRIGIVVQRETGPLRLRSLGARTILGEMGLYRSLLRSASAIAERDTVAYALSRANLQAIERDDPPLAAAFHSSIVRELSHRLSYQNVQAVLHGG